LILLAMDLAALPDKTLRLIRPQGSRRSMPWQYVGKEVGVREIAGEVDVLLNTVPVIPLFTLRC
jgi:hypothetical protein